LSYRGLLSWGGISAWIAALLLAISIASYWITGGIEFRAWVPLFSAFACFLMVTTTATYEYLAPLQYSLARAGLPFAALSILILLLEAAVWGADRTLRRAASSVGLTELTPQSALFNSLHMLVLWLIAVWMALWGLALLRTSGAAARTTGIFMCSVAGFNAVDYLLARLGQEDILVELWHLGGQISLLGVLTTSGWLLSAASGTGTGSSEMPPPTRINRSGK